MISQHHIDRNRAMQADLRKKYAAYIDRQKAKFNAPGATMSMILPTYMEWLRSRR